VVSIEHRDGSGPRTFINLPKDRASRFDNVDVDAKDWTRGYAKRDYVFPKDNARDTMPGNKQGVDGALRSPQIQFHLQQVTMLGHSFGAATTVEVLRHKDRFRFVGQGSFSAFATWKNCRLI